MVKSLEQALKELYDAIARGAAYHKGTEVLPLDLDRDFDAIERLVIHEEWPFMRSDFELSHAQPGGCSRVAYRDGMLAGFFTTHAFGKIGYLDMMVIATDFRRTGVARPVFVSVMHGLAVNGMQSYVVHTTNDSARIIGLIGFRKTDTDFTLVVRDPAPIAAAAAQEECRGTMFVSLTESDESELIDLDAAIFGMRREAWIRKLLYQSTTKMLGLKDSHGNLLAALWLRARREGAFCIDGCVYRTLTDLDLLIHHTVTGNATTRLECFARTGSRLHDLLDRLGFVQPDFFRAIGPLTEWHKGKVDRVGTKDKVQCLMWL